MSRTFRLNKLTRDGIVPRMEAEGQQVTYRVLEGDEYIAALRDKLVEEAREGDLCDLKQVIDDLAEAEGITAEALNAGQEAKRHKVGGFSARLFVETVTVGDDDPWATYYAAEPERFPEEMGDE